MKLVILDRDGVINKDSPDYIRTADQWIPESNSIEAITCLCKAGFSIAIATNQSGIGRGYFSRKTLQAIHKKMLDMIEAQGGYISAISFCPHHPDEKCHCRKPNPGLIESIEKKLGITAKGAWFVGDSAKDMELAENTGCRPVLVKTGNGKLTLAKGVSKQTLIFENLYEFANYLLKTN